MPTSWTRQEDLALVVDDKWHRYHEILAQSEFTPRLTKELRQTKVTQDDVCIKIDIQGMIKSNG